MRHIIVATQIVLLYALTFLAVAYAGDAKVQHTVTLTAPPDMREDPNVLNVAEFDAKPSDETIKYTLRTKGGARYPDAWDKSACNDAEDCGRAIKDTCGTLGHKVKKQAYDMARGCSGECANGTKVVVTCVTP